MGDKKPYRHRRYLDEDERVAGWYRDLKQQLKQFAPYLVAGRLVTFQTIAPEEQSFYERLLESLTVPETVCALFIPPSVVQQAMWPLARGRGVPPSTETYAVSPDAGAILAQACGDTTTIVNALFAFPPYAPGIDIYQEGCLLAGYISQDIESCMSELSGHLAAYLT